MPEELHWIHLCMPNNSVLPSTFVVHIMSILAFYRGLKFLTVSDSRRSWMMMFCLKVAKFSQGSSSVQLWENENQLELGWSLSSIALASAEFQLILILSELACLPLLCQGSKWLYGKSVWLVIRRSWVRIPAGSWIFFRGFISHSLNQ